MSIGIEAWVRMESDSELHIGELVEVDGVDGPVLAYHDPDHVAVMLDEMAVTVAVDDVRRAQRGPFVVVTMNGDGDENARYFEDMAAAEGFASSSDDDVVSFEGLMA